MTAETKELLDKYQIRKSPKQKEAFRAWLADVLKSYDYEPYTESSGSLVKSTNLIVGNPEQAKVVYTAHYDTCAVLPFPNLITPRNLFLYLLYQILIVIPMFALAIAAEVLLLVLWPDCPMIFALLLVYLVLGFCFWWIIAGPANKHTVNDNTSGVVVLLETALSLPTEQRDQVAFVFFDNEEKGLLGSTWFKKQHGNAMKETLLINFDCVSDGDYIQFFPNKALKAQNETITLLESCFQSKGTKNVEVVRGFGFYPSDQRAFPYGVGVAALHKSKIGFWLSRIHTPRDTVFQAENIDLLCNGALTLAAQVNKDKN